MVTGAGRCQHGRELGVGQDFGGVAPAFDDLDDGCGIVDGVGGPDGANEFNDKFAHRSAADTSSVARAAEYQARAVDRIREIIAEQHAAVRCELESRIAEGYWPSSGQNIDPHHITNAVRHLVRRGELEWIGGTTRGGADVETLQPSNRTGRGDRIDRAAPRWPNSSRPASDSRCSRSSVVKNQKESRKQRIWNRGPRGQVWECGGVA